MTLANFGVLSVNVYILLKPNSSARWLMCFFLYLLLQLNFDSPVSHGKSNCNVGVDWGGGGQVEPGWSLRAESILTSGLKNMLSAFTVREFFKFTQYSTSLHKTEIYSVMLSLEAVPRLEVASRHFFQVLVLVLVLAVKALVLVLVVRVTVSVLVLVLAQTVLLTCRGFDNLTI